MNAIVRFIIGPNDRTFFDGEKFIVKAVEFKNYTGLAEGLSIKSTQVITIIVALVTMLILFYFELQMINLFDFLILHLYIYLLF